MMPVSFATLLFGAVIRLAVGDVHAASLEERFEELEKLLHATQQQIGRQTEKIHQLEAERRLGSYSSVAADLATYQVKVEKEFEAFKAKDSERRLQSASWFAKELENQKAETARGIEDLKAKDTAIQGGMNHMWLILCGAIVMLMQAGFACVEAGNCRAKNVQNILLKNLTDVAVGTLGWWSLGFAFAYGNPDTDADGVLDNGFIGSQHFFGTGFMETNEDGTQIPNGSMAAMWFFQWTFASASSTIVSGGVAERVNFPGYCLYSFSMSAFIYPVVIAWTWGYGWISQMNDIGFMDFGGSGIVHMAGGVGSLVGSIISGPRNGRWTEPEIFVPHSLPLVVLGTFILWFGWYGFNCGSTLKFPDESTGQHAAQVAMNTTIAGATGGLSVFIIRLVALKGYYDIGGFCNGILAGLVSITAGCSTTDCGSAFTIGLLGAVIYELASRLIQFLQIDDPIDAFPVHGACGAWGVLAAALFDWGKGFDYAHGWSGLDCTRGGDGKCIEGLGTQLLAANVVEILAVTAWVGGLSAAVFYPLRLAGVLRAADYVQEKGMDESKHSPTKAYSYGEA